MRRTKLNSDLALSLMPACDSVAHLTTPVLDTTVFPLSRKCVPPTLLLKLYIDTPLYLTSPSSLDKLVPHDKLCPRCHSQMSAWS